MNYEELIDGIIDLADELNNCEKSESNETIDLSEFLNIENLDEMLSCNMIDYTFNNQLFV